MKDFELKEELGRGTRSVVRLAFARGERASDKPLAMKMCTVSKLRKMKFLTQSHAGLGSFFSALDELEREIAVLETLSERTRALFVAPFPRLHTVVREEEEDSISLALDCALCGRVADYDERRYSFTLSPSLVHILRTERLSLSSLSPSLSEYVRRCFPAHYITEEEAHHDDNHTHKHQRKTPPFLLSAAQATHCAVQLLAGLHFLHSQGVCHRDIKPDNILCTLCDLSVAAAVADNAAPVPLSFSLRLQFADFGCAQVFDRESNPHALVSDSAGSLMFWSPESIDPLRFGERDMGLTLDEEEGNKRGNEKEAEAERDILDFSPSEDEERGGGARRRCYSAYTADLWALGVTLHCLHFLRFPFAVRRESVAQQLKEIVDCEVPILRMHPEIARVCEATEEGRERLRQRKEGEGALCEVISGLLAREPAMRWSIENALEALGFPL